METINLNPIGKVASERREPKDDDWDAVKSEIRLDQDRFTPEAVAELGTFSHIVVIFYMHRVKPEKIVQGARHPRNNPDWPKVGIFAQRGKNRPNTLGVTVCRLKEVEGLTLRVQGLDAIDGTPVLDIKPWVVEYGPRGEVRQPGWMAEVMKKYWK